MNEQEEYLMIDHTVEIDISSLPKLLQNTIWYYVKKKDS